MLRLTETVGAFYTSGGVSNLPFLAVANVDGPGIAEGPVLSVTPGLPELQPRLWCRITHQAAEYHQLGHRVELHVAG